MNVCVYVCVRSMHWLMSGRQYGESLLSYSCARYSILTHSPLPGLFVAAVEACSVEPDLCPHRNRRRRTLSSSVTAHHISVSVWIYECINLHAEGGIMQRRWRSQVWDIGFYKCRFVCAAAFGALENSYCSHWIWVVLSLIATQRLSGPTKHVMLSCFRVKNLLESYSSG